MTLYSILRGFELFCLPAPHRITSSFEPKEFLAALNDYPRKSLEAIQIRVVKRAVGLHCISDRIDGPVRDREVAVPDSARSATVAIAVERDEADTTELPKTSSGELSLFLKSIRSKQACG